MNIGKILAFGIAFSVIFLKTPTSVIAQSAAPASSISWQKRSDQIRQRWAQLKPSKDAATSPYQEAPLLGPEFRAGSLTEEFKREGLNSVNFARFLAYLPDDVKLDEGLAAQAQCGALLLAHLKHLDHTPKRPEDFSEDLFTLAYRATSSSNLAQGPRTLGGATELYMDDSPTGKIDAKALIALGHRRWILNPVMTRTAFGFVNGFSTMQSFDRSRTADVPMEFVAWPAPVAHPLEWFAPHVIWSVTFNPTVYSWNAQDLTVKLKRTRDGRIWNFSSEKSDGYFAFNTQGFGVNNCLMFRPDDVGALQDGDHFEVEVSGLQNSDENVATVHYETTFFTLQSHPNPKPEINQ